MIGGRIIEIREVDAGVTRLWCINGNDECAVLVETAMAMPLLGDEIWWQCGKVYWDGDRRELRKIAYSFDPRNVK